MTTLAGAATGLRTHANYAVMLNDGLAYSLSDRVAVEAIAGTTKHSVRAREDSL